MKAMLKLIIRLGIWNNEYNTNGSNKEADSMQEQMNNLSREIKILRNKKEILEIKNTVI